MLWFSNFIDLCVSPQIQKLWSGRKRCFAKPAPRPLRPHLQPLLTGRPVSVHLSKYHRTLYSAIALLHCGKVIGDVESVLQQHHDGQRAESGMEHHSTNGPIEVGSGHHPRRVEEDIPNVVKKTYLT